MSAARTTIDRIALGRAASVYISFTSADYANDPFSGYLAFEAAVDTFSNPSGMTVLPELENNHELALELINSLAERIGQDIKSVLEMAKEGIVNETIECRLDSDMNTLDMPGLVEIGAGQTDAYAPSAPTTPEDDDFAPVLRRYHVSVTRVAHSNDKTISVLATSREEADERAIEAAFDLEFTDVASEYESCISPNLIDDVEPGEVLTWRDPDGGSEQEVVLKAFRGGAAICTTESGGELEALPSELF